MSFDLKSVAGGVKNFVTSKLGLFGGGGTESFFLPHNDLIQTYNLDPKNLFRVRMNAYPVNFTKVTSDGGQPKVDGEVADTEPVWQCEVLHNEDSLTVSHRHNYGNPGGLIGTAKNLFEAGKFGVSGLDLLRNMQELDNLLAGKGINTSNIKPFRTEWNDFASSDMAKSYKGTAAPQSFTTSFLLFSSSDPFLEVVLPSIVFSYLSYPTLNREKSLQDILGTAKQMLSRITAPEAQPQAEKTMGETAKETATSSLKGIVEASQGIFKDRWRIRLGDPPPYWTVSSSNGIVYLSNAHLSDVQITYYGPWLQAKSTSSSSMVGGVIKSVLGAVAPAIAGGAAGGALQFQQIYGEAFATASGGLKGLGMAAINSFLEGETDLSNLSGFPSYAEVKLTFTSNFDQVFAEEILLGLLGANAQFGQNITTGFMSKLTNAVANKIPGGTAIKAIAGGR